MRLDKYLKVARIIKRRTISKDIIDFGQVKVNGRIAKPSTQLKIHDIILLSLANKEITIRVLSLDEKIKKGEAINLYEILQEKNIKSPLEA